MFCLKDGIKPEIIELETPLHKFSIQHRTRWWGIICGRGGNNIVYQCEFEDVLGEPEGARSIDCVWKLSYTCFNLWKGLCYKIATLCCGICMAAEWGCEFAAIALHHIWCATPCMKVCDINCHLYRKCYTLCIDCCLGPLCETLGLCLSRIKIAKG